MSVWERRKFCMARDQLVRFLRTTPLLSVRLMTTTAMVVECEQFIFVYMIHTLKLG